MTSHVNDVLEAVQSFIAKGYDREYRVQNGNLVDLELGSILDSRTIRVDAALRLEAEMMSEIPPTSTRSPIQRPTIKAC